jgi:ankyrin repeat protein
MNMKHLAISAIALLAGAGVALADSPLADAIESGDRETAMELLRDGADVNEQQPDGATALMWAVYNVDVDLARTLINEGAEADVQNKYGASALTEAVQLVHPEMVELLLAAGADADSANADGQTALMLAARTGNMDIVRMLVDAGADVNTVEQWRGQTALMWAAGSNQNEVARYLIEQGADVSVRAKHNDWGAQVTSEPRAQYRQTGGLTPLLYAAREGCYECAVAIVEAGADIELPNPDGITPLIMAIDNLNYDVAAYLLDQGADPHRWDWWGRTPLYVAVDMKNYFAGRGGFDPDGPSEGRAPVVDGQVTAMDVINRLLAAGVDPDAQLNLWRPGRNSGGRFVDDSLTVGTTPLFMAAINYDNETVQALLNAGAEVDIPNVMGVSPLMGAAGMGISTRDSRGNYLGDVESRAIPTLELLVAAGADINKRVEGTTTRTGRIARISSMTDKEGQTAMYSCAQWGWTEVCRWLLDHGGDVKVTDALGKTPVDAARNLAGGRERKVTEEIAAMYEAAGGVATVQQTAQAEPAADAAAAAAN